MGERLNGIQEVDGSIPFSSTNKIKHLACFLIHSDLRLCIGSEDGSSPSLVPIALPAK